MSDRPDAAGRGGPVSGRTHAAFTTTDGLRLTVTVHGDPASPWVPVVCLPGLGRTARDFDDLARRLSAAPDRRRFVAAFDLRGRGSSQWDGDPANYSALTDMDDVLDGMAALGMPRAVVVGTGHGGIAAMLMGAARPNAVAGLVLNDIGPTIESLGLARIKSTLGRLPVPRDWDDAAAILRRLHGRSFAALDGAGWAAWAHAVYRDEGGRPILDHDPALAAALDGVVFDRPVPSLQDEFRAVADIPCLVIRGESSDLLSAETVEAMKVSHPGLRALVVPGQGHAPLLRGTELLEEIAGFLRMVDDRSASSPSPAGAPAAAGLT